MTMHRPADVADVQHGSPSGTICPVRVAHLQLPDVVDAAAEPGVGLDVDLPGAAKIVEVVDVVRAQVDLQGVEHVAQRHAQRPCLDRGRCPGAARACWPAELVNRPCRPGVSLPLVDDLVAHCLQLAQSEVAAVLDDQLEAAGVPRPSMGGVPKTSTTAAADLAVDICRRNASAIASAGFPGRAARQTSSSITYIEPNWAHWRPAAATGPRWPPCARRPAVLRAISSIRRMTLCVRSHRGRVGQLHVEQQIALVLLRNEAGRACGRRPNRSVPAGRRRQPEPAG